MKRMSLLLHAAVAVVLAGAVDGASATPSSWAVAGDLAAQPKKDKKPPTPPAGVTASAISDSQIALSWSPSIDDRGVAQYLVLRDGALIQITPATSGGDTGLTAGSTHCYTIKAVDTSGNVSRPSARVCATTLSDITPPAPPADVRTSVVTDTSVEIAWTASPSTDTAGYRIFRDGLALATVKASPYVDRTVASGSTYCYSVAAVDGALHESVATSPSCVFTDATPPAVVAEVPAAGTTNAGVDGAITVTFSEDVVSDSGATPFILRDGAGKAVGGFAWIAGNMLTFRPSVPLAAGTEYAATVTTAVTDVYGNRPAADYTWRFTTGGAFGVISDLVASDDPKIVYGLDRERQMLYVIDTVARSVAEELAVPLEQPTAMAYSGVDKKLYVVSPAAADVAVFDAAAKTFTTFSLGSGQGLLDIAVAPSLRRIYILSATETGIQLVIVNQDSGEVIGSTPAAGAFLVVDAARKVIVTGDAGTSPSSLYRYSVDGDVVAFLQTVWNAGSNGLGLAISHDGSRVVFPCGGGNGDYGYFLFDFATANLDTVAGQWNIGTYPAFAVFSPDDKVLYAANGDPYDNSLYIMDTATYQLIRKDPFPHSGDYRVIAPNSDGTVVVGFSYDTYYNNERSLYFFDGIPAVPPAPASPAAQ